jgi:hypothetical protein
LENKIPPSWGGGGYGSWTCGGKNNQLKTTRAPIKKENKEGKDGEKKITK